MKSRCQKTSPFEALATRHQKPHPFLWLIGVALLALVVLNSASAQARAHIADASDQAVWHKLRKTYFGHRPIEDGRSVIRLDAPYRAEDPAVVPIKITDLTTSEPNRHIVKLWLIIDNNPKPMSAQFDFGPAAASATIATRVRVNTYTNMRAIAQTEDDKLFMVRRFVKASGGCSAPVSRDPTTALAHMGEMRLRNIARSSTSRAAEARVELMIRHPNITGLQMNQLTRLVQPAHYVDAIAIHKGNALVLDSHMTFSLSENPSLRFGYLENRTDSGELRVRVHDNKGNVFNKQWPAAQASAATTIEKRS